MSRQQLKPNLQGLTLRERISDALYRALLAYDHHDTDLFDSAWLDSPDTTLIVASKETKGIDAVRKGFHHIGPFVTTHHASNLRIDVAGEHATTARLTARAQNHHYKLGQGNVPGSDGFVPTGNPNPTMYGGGTYFIDLEIDPSDGLWKIKKFDFDVLWIQGPLSVID